MMLPGAKVQLSGMDKGLIAYPLAAGISILAFKVGQVIPLDARLDLIPGRVRVAASNLPGAGGFPDLRPADAAAFC